MTNENLKEIIQEIANIADTAPEQYREACFKELLRMRLGGQQTPASIPVTESSAQKTSSDEVESIPKKLRKLFSDVGLEMEQVETILNIGDSVEIELGHIGDKAADVNRRVALLLGFADLLKDGDGTISLDVIKRCSGDLGFEGFHAGNFKTNLKAGTSKSHFVIPKSGKEIKLTPTGRRAAAELVKELAEGI